MTAMQQQPWRRLAPTALPYTQSRPNGASIEHKLDEAAYRESFRVIPTADLRDHLEHLRYLAVEYAAVPNGRAVAEIQITYVVDELARRQALIATGDPLAPPWPRKRTDIPERIRAVKAAWPIERMVTDLLGCQLQRYGPDRMKARCPFHEERTPSFTVFVKEDRAFCFGCQQGGDVLELAGIRFGYTRFLDKLECLERFAGITPAGNVS